MRSIGFTLITSLLLSTVSCGRETPRLTINYYPGKSVDDFEYRNSKGLDLDLECVRRIEDFNAGADINSYSKVKLSLGESDIELVFLSYNEARSFKTAVLSYICEYRQEAHDKYITGASFYFDENGELIFIIASKRLESLNTPVPRNRGWFWRYL